MIRVFCNGCDTELWEGLSQQEIAAVAEDAIEVKCSDCILYGEMKWDKNRNQQEKCQCGHSYERHYDGYENNAPVGCKYCHCERFKPVREV